MIRTAVKFGVFVAICLGFTLWLAFTIGNVDFEDRYTLTASFDDISGLLVDDNVKVAGVVVGKATGIQVESGRAVVTFNVRDSIELPADSTSASIRWRNLIGQRYVYLNPNGVLDVGEVTLADGDVIDDTNSVIDLGELFNQLGPIVAAIDSSQVNEFLDSMTAALEGNEQSISDTLDDLAVLVDGLASRDDAIGRLIDNTEVVARTLVDRDTQIESMLENLVLLSDTLGDNTALLSQALDELGAFGRDLSFLLENNRAQIDRAVINLDSIVEEVDDNLDAVDRLLDVLPDTSAAVFNSSRHGEWLNQAILCINVERPTGNPPSCPTPLIPGLDALASGTAVPATTATAPRSGADALLAIFGAVP